MPQGVEPASLACPGLQRSKLHFTKMQVCNTLSSPSAPTKRWTVAVQSEQMIYLVLLDCWELKFFLRISQQQAESRRRAAVNEMMRQRAVEAATFGQMDKWKPFNLEQRK